MSAANTSDGVSRSSSRVNLTSSDVNGWPSDHSTPWPQGDVDALRVGGGRVALGQPRNLLAGVVVVEIQELEDRLVQDVPNAPQCRPANRGSCSADPAISVRPGPKPETTSVSLRATSARRARPASVRRARIAAGRAACALAPRLGNRARQLTRRGVANRGLAIVERLLPRVPRQCRAVGGRLT